MERGTDCKCDDGRGGNWNYNICPSGQHSCGKTDENPKLHCCV